MVYFSFDDGPDGMGDTTARLLDVLKKYQIKALFCLLGENVEYYPELVKRIYDEGHYIANHGYSEKHAYKMNDNEFRDNLIRGGAAISSVLGFDMNPKLYRPHGGFNNSRQEKICIDEGYTIVPVTVRVYDAVDAATKRKKIIKKTINLVEKRGGGLILLHDGRDSYARRETKLERNPNGAFNRSWIPDAVEEIIIALLDKGFNLNSSNILDLFALIEQVQHNEN
jgi:peptidoglycan/xylan/chitin deacetylase (PgdA/CDA1 family)